MAGGSRLACLLKYRRRPSLPPGPFRRKIRDCVSFERLSRCAEFAGNKVAARLTMLRWALFQFLTGNSDAHGKNFSLFVRLGGLLEPADWHDAAERAAVRRLRFGNSHGVWRRLRAQGGIRFRPGRLRHALWHRLQARAS